MLDSNVRTCEDAPLQGGLKFASWLALNLIQLCPNVITGVFNSEQRKPQRNCSQKMSLENKRSEGCNAGGFEARVKERGQPQETAKRKETESPLEPPKGSKHLASLIFSSVRSNMDS